MVAGVYMVYLCSDSFLDKIVVILLIVQPELGQASILFTLVANLCSHRAIHGCLHPLQISLWLLQMAIQRWAFLVCPCQNISLIIENIPMSGFQ